MDALDNLVKINELKAEPPDQAEFDGMLAAARSKLGSWGFSVLKRHNPLQPPWLLASSGVLTSS